MKEKDIQTLFSKKNIVTGVFELKLIKGPSFAFSRLAQHQEYSLYASEHGSLAYKISDMSADQKPFDCFRLSGVPAYVVLVWYAPRKWKRAYYIRIARYIEHVAQAARKSMKESEAKELAEFIINL